MPDVVTLGETMALFAPREAGPLRYISDFRLKFGGAETNFATALVRLGLSAGWISRLGDDELGRFIAHNLRGEGVDISRVGIDPEAPTGLYVKELSAVGETSVYYYRRGSAARHGSQPFRRPATSPASKPSPAPIASTTAGTS